MSGSHRKLNSTNSAKPTDHLSALPTDVLLLHIFPLLRIRDLFRLSSASKFLCQVSELECQRLCRSKLRICLSNKTSRSGESKNDNRILCNETADSKSHRSMISKFLKTHIKHDFCEGCIKCFTDHGKNKYFRQRHPLFKNCASCPVRGCVQCLNGIWFEGCSSCDKLYCQDCDSFEECTECFDRICPTCVNEFSCGGCGLVACNDCIDSEMTKCSKCNVYYCFDCRVMDFCADCDEAFCKRCIAVDTCFICEWRLCVTCAVSFSTYKRCAVLNPCDEGGLCCCKEIRACKKCSDSNAALRETRGKERRRTGDNDPKGCCQCCKCSALRVDAE